MVDKAFIIERSDFHQMFEVLALRGYTPIGPTVRDGAIIYDELNGVEDLPEGWSEEQEAGRYRLKKRNDAALFGFNSGPHSWKRYLFPPESTLWQAVKVGDDFTLEEPKDRAKPFAFIGVRSCDLHAIEIQDRVFMNGQNADPLYSNRRRQALVIAVNCGQAANTCFCTSMNTGPRVEAGYDLALTEIVEVQGDEEKHYFLAEIGSDRGLSLLNDIAHIEAGEEALLAARKVSKRAEQQMGRKVDITDIKELLYRNYDNKRWEALEKRCLACGNCTMACPTCFCSKVEDVTDLTGDHAERRRVWDSCFTTDFSYLHGGSVRQGIGSRYRQWLTHKLATWYDQFGTSGCVGCGRCVTWCPVGIDLTEEVRLIRESDVKSEREIESGREIESESEGEKSREGIDNG